MTWGLALEALKISLFCLLVAFLAVVLGAGPSLSLILFTTAVMISAATFSAQRRELRHLNIGAAVVVLSIFFSGLLAVYVPLLGMVATIPYAGLAFLLPKTKRMFAIWVNGAVTFVVMTVFPIDWAVGLLYLLCGAGIYILLLIFHWLLERRPLFVGEEEKAEQAGHLPAATVVISLIAAWIAAYFLARFTHFDHLFWIALTVIVVTQGSHQKTVRTSLTRIGINIVGALLIVLIYGYALPPNFWAQISIPLATLFGIFLLSFSYGWRTLFIELFVLSISHLLGDFRPELLGERVVLTLIGGVIVIMTTYGVNRMSR